LTRTTTSQKKLSLFYKWKALAHAKSLLPSAKGLSFTFMLSLHLLPLCTIEESIVVILSIMCMVPKFIIDWFMTMVLLVFKLFVSSHPLKLEGVLCIYVFLLHEGQAEYHFAMFFYMLETHNWLSLHYYSWSFVCVAFHVITWLLSSIVKIISFMPMFRVLWSQHSMFYIVWSRLCWCMSPQKLLFCYHLPTRGRAVVKLGDAWYFSNTSIIFDDPCLFMHHLLCVLFILRGVFMHFPELTY
jgi:hypothetical protein